VFENRVLRKIFGPKRDDVTGEWRRLYNEQLHDLHPSPDIIHVIKSRSMRLGGGARDFERGEERCIQGCGGETRREKATWEDLGMDGKITKFTLINRMEREGEWTELIWLRLGITDGLM
jgi:hypothetical protein